MNNVYKTHFAQNIWGGGGGGGGGGGREERMGHVTSLAHTNKWYIHTLAYQWTTDSV